ncbi:putative P-loop containing nucleoside triphosphate hydrolase, leucine-rich repeat domain, L [Rosa chinensis]|uniref:Putative P-loop containing nucleoside triphosphate hydrolase, leucine-rich repeat domain, L n=1 Tax=Rosa chinensis TaxID=74649 RepID=A0A2P6PMP1_ROSCH|nr:probable disease resistance protein At1g61190 [Rosa chinensis]XP_024166530.1 probable disease resistance protein At1g61190 [Rosa chinensis]PRQ23176.1 putative P-loop containing nucleoside triphosphate hydrolase, leucine-rich repeat domain, L [Rosa chinensis]
MDPGTAATILSCLCPINVLQETTAQRCSYLNKNPKEKIEELRSKIEELRALFEDVNRKLKHACIQERKAPTAQVKLWLENVQKFDNNERRDLLSQEEKRCLCRYLPNYASRRKLGKLVEKTIKMVDELLRKGQLIKDDSLTYLLVENVKALPTTVIVSNESTKRTIGEIWRHLTADHEVKKIGVYGIGGVGKTTIMKEINNQLKREMEEKKITCFDNVIWITMPKSSNSEKLQKTIAKSVSLHLLDHWDTMENAAALLEALTRRKKLLLIFDDVWTGFSLENVGIPEPTGENGCKFILTTRSLRVCRAMETDKEVEVKMLSEDETWSLFSEKVGSTVLQKTEIYVLARKVAKEFGGLPLAIVTVGRALRKVENEMGWQNALTALRESAANVEGMEEMVFSCLRFSYERLDDNIVRSCFLYCALYPEGHHIEAKELIENWLWEGLLGDVGRLQANIWKGQMILANLKDSCLLDHVNAESGIECVKMHDLIRDMAIDITRKSSHVCLIRAGIAVERIQIQSEEIEDVKRISMMYNDLICLPKNLSCPKLSSLLLQYCSADKVTDLCFTGMQNLKVLDLSFTGISCLSESIANLRNLRALLLRSCWNLTRLPSLELLEALWDLDLSYTPIRSLPLGMEMLHHLKRLNLSYTELDSFPEGLLTTLNFLEELLLFGSQCAFGLELVNELIACINIVVLEVQFQGSEVFNIYTRSGHWNNLQSFRFDICSFFYHNIGAIRKHVERSKSITCIGSFFVNGTRLLLPDCTSELQLRRCNDVDILSRCLSDSIQLKKCAVRYCNQMESIVTTAENNLNSLNSLKLYSLTNLKMLCRGVVPLGTFGDLMILQISCCHSIETLFTVTLIEQLGNLEELTIRYCLRLKVLIQEEGSIQRAEVSLPRLKNLELYTLLELESIYSEDMICNSLSTITVQKCPGLKKLPITISTGQGDPQRQPSTTPPIKEIIAERWWWDSVVLANPDAKTILWPRLVEPTMMYLELDEL